MADTTWAYLGFSDSTPDADGFARAQTSGASQGCLGGGKDVGQRTSRFACVCLFPPFFFLLKETAKEPFQDGLTHSFWPKLA